ncbi:MAG: radical SAM protein [Ruminococcus sp.]|nr:radical SAM protein [Ruminococcus sp.]
MLKNCRLCPRRCGIDRYEKSGYCGTGAEILGAKACLHQWEEPCISYKNGAGTVFFSGCGLHCCFCQNNSISSDIKGKSITVNQLGDIFLRLRDSGADSIELVTPTHFAPQIISALDMVKNQLGIPVIWNSGGYELPETIELLNGYIDVYLPDIKYYSPQVSAKYSNAPDYFEYASEAVLKMTEQVGKLTYNSEGGLVRGTIIRHLVLPSHRHDSMKILDWIAENISPENALLSLMSQYTPFEHVPENCPELRRRVTKMEYNSVVRHADELGLKGFMQEKTSASAEYVPDFDFSGL